MKFLSKECFLGLIFFLLSCIVFAQNTGITINPPQTSAVNNLPGQTNTDSLKRELAKQKNAAAAQFTKTQLTAMITKTDDNRFGYYILADGLILIDQKNIPAVPGNKGFISEAEAKRTANFAIKKLKQGEMPPTITHEELIKLKITLTHINK